MCEKNCLYKSSLHQSTLLHSRLYNIKYLKTFRIGNSFRFFAIKMSYGDSSIGFLAFRTLKSKKESVPSAVKPNKSHYSAPTTTTLQIWKCGIN